MTLAIAVVKNLPYGRRQIYLGSDSCITSGPLRSHFGPKLADIKVRIVHPLENGQEHEDAAVYFEKDYGLAFAGTFTGIHIMRSYLDVILGNLQFVPVYCRPSFQDICEIVQKVYRAAMPAINQELQYEFSPSFFLAGVDPSDPSLKLARFDSDADEVNGEVSTRLSFAILPPDDGIYCIGSNEADFNNLLLGRLNLPLEGQAFTALRDICARRDIESVGGSIQIGFFTSQDNFGIRCFNGSDHQGDFGDHLAGLNLNQLDDCSWMHSLSIRRSCVFFRDQ